MKDKASPLIGVLLILMGLILGGSALGIFNQNIIWPLMPLLVGIGLLLGYILYQQYPGLLMPGSILVIISLPLFYCTISGNWESMTTIWPIFILAPSIGFFVTYFIALKEKSQLILAIILFLTGLLFLLINIYFGAFWSVILIILGLLLIGLSLIRRQPKKQPSNINKDNTEQEQQTNTIQ